MSSRRLRFSDIFFWLLGIRRRRFLSECCLSFQFSWKQTQDSLSHSMNWYSARQTQIAIVMSSLLSCQMKRECSLNSCNSQWNVIQNREITTSGSAVSSARATRPRKFVLLYFFTRMNGREIEFSPDGLCLGRTSDSSRTRDKRTWNVTSRRLTTVVKMGMNGEGLANWNEH